MKIGVKILREYRIERLKPKSQVRGNGKRQIQVENFSEKKIRRQKLSRTILMDKTVVTLLIFEYV